MKRAVLLVPLLAVSALTACGDDDATPRTSLTHVSGTQPNTSSSTSSSSSSNTSTSTSSGTSSTAASTGSPTPTHESSTGSTAPLTTTQYLCHMEEGDEVCSASAYADNRRAMAAYDKQNGAPGSTKFDPRLDALAPGGPTMPQYLSTPSVDGCQRYVTQLNQWAAYQNAHRPAGAAKVPTSAQSFFLQTQCQMDTPGD